MNGGDIGSTKAVERRTEAPGQQRDAYAPAFALWNLGFRPFYLLASAFAALSIGLWACEYAGYLPGAYLRSPVWHGHEMLFGYTLAVLTGFLFTAVRTWTGEPTPTGLKLAGFALLWVAGRILVLSPYATAAAVVTVAFPVAVAIGIGIPLVRSSSRRHYMFIVLLLLLGVAALVLHLSQLRIVDWPERANLQVGLDLVLFIMAAISGRVIPMFTNNGIPGAMAKCNPLVERLALGGILLLLGADLLEASTAVITLLALVVAITHAVRLYLWQPWRAVAAPLIWILHAAYGWIVISLVLRSLAATGLIAETLAVHALTIGAIGGMTIGMMTRTARGHTGRPLLADNFEIACFVLVQLAAVVRVLGGMLLPDRYPATVIVAGACWSGAFALFAVRYWPVLSRTRLDGKPG